jgi:aspartate 1-decarboxylase
VTGADLNYEGSISICPDLLEASGLVPWERVDIFDVNNGERFSTYVIEGGKGEICLNGAAARLVHEGDLVIIVAYCTVGEDELARHRPRIVLVDGDNRPVPVEPGKGGGAALP